MLRTINSNSKYCSADFSRLWSCEHVLPSISGWHEPINSIICKSRQYAINGLHQLCPTQPTEIWNHLYWYTHISAESITSSINITGTLFPSILKLLGITFKSQLSFKTRHLDNKTLQPPHLDDSLSTWLKLPQSNPF